MEDIYGTLGAQSLFYLILTLGCILISFWALRIVRWEVFIKDIKSPQSKVLQVLVAVALGYVLAQFFISYSSWSSMLKGLF